MRSGFIRKSTDRAKTRIMFESEKSDMTADMRTSLGQTKGKHIAVWVIAIEDLKGIQSSGSSSSGPSDPVLFDFG